jgi:hypothetical protein
VPACAEQEKVLSEYNQINRNRAFHVVFFAFILPGAARLVVEVLQIEKLDLKLLELIGKVVVFLEK